MVSALLIIPPKNFRDEELLDTKAILEGAGVKTVIASKEKVLITGMLGSNVTPELALNEVNLADYDAVIFIGGSGAAAYFQDEAVLELAKKAYETVKVLAAICIAPSILANAGLLEGKRATVSSFERSNLESHGATYTGAEVEADGKIVTANGPGAAEVFAGKILELLKK